MTVYFTSTEIQQIQQWHNDGLLAGNRSAMYLGIAGILENKLSTASETDQASLRQDILWMQGASQANLGQGVHATLIRSYTQAQAQLRLGVSVTDDLMQQASNAVGDAVFNTIIDPANYKAVPDISVIAKQDATAVGNTIFSSIPLDSGKSHNAGWSGGVLFSLLGSDQTAVLLTNGNGLENLDDARNVLFAMYSLTKALQAAWETGKDEAIEYFDSLVQGGGSGPIATDLSIGFSTFTSASDFVQPAVAFFQHTGLFGAVTEFAQYGLSDILDFMRSTVAGAVVSDTSDIGFAPNAYAFFSKYADSLTSWGVSLPGPDTLLANALNPTSAGDAYRNALAALSPIVIAGMPLSGRDVSLWQAGMTSGLTPDYLTARADMLKLELQYDASGDSIGSVVHELSFSSQAYYDLAVSPNALYTKTGYLSSTTDITMFGGAGPETLKCGAGDDRLFAGSGADVLDGGAGSNTLEGGSGVDTFLVDQGNTGSDIILDVDRKGQILFENGSEVGPSTCRRAVVRSPTSLAPALVPT